MNSLFNLIIFLIETITGARKERLQRQRMLESFRQWVKPKPDTGYGYRQCCNCGAHIMDVRLCGYCRTTGRNDVLQIDERMAESVRVSRRVLQLHSAPLRAPQHPRVYEYPPGSLVEL